MRGRGDRLEAALAERELDRMLVTDLINVRYLTGFTGTNGACVCGPGLRLFFTDFRYTERAAAEVEGWESLTVDRRLARRRSPSASTGTVGFEDDHLAVRTLAKLKEKLADGVEPVAGRRRRSSALRRVKDERGAGGDRRGLEARRRGLAAGASSAASPAAPSARSPAPPKRGSASSAASPPSRRSSPPGPTAPCRTPSPATREIGTGELVVFDMGAQARRLLLGRHPHLRHRRARRGGARGLRGRAARPSRPRWRRSAAGVKGEDVDAVARKMIADAGHGEHFGHGLGHGVGLEVHEGPRLSLRSDDVLAPGEVVTVEPGIYLPGGSGCGSRTSSSSPRTASAISAVCRKSCSWSSSESFESGTKTDTALG